MAAASIPVPPALIVVGVDGTGTSDSAQYRVDFENSFVNRVLKQTPTSYKAYQRGPNLADIESRSHCVQTTGQLGREVFSAVRLAWHCMDEAQRKNCRIVLTGYSRGGAAVIHAATLLQPAVVDYLILFDAVDRSLGVDAERIPANVTRVWHAIRDPQTNSRPYFGNCGLICSSARTRLTVAQFWATHGGLGGCPWRGGKPDEKIAEGPAPGNTTVNLLTNAARVATFAAPVALAAVAARAALTTNVTYAQDAVGSQLVWDWMSRHLLNASLISRC